MNDRDPGDEQPDPREQLQAWLDKHTTPGRPTGMKLADLFDHDKRVRYMQEQRELDALYEQVDSMREHQWRVMFPDAYPLRPRLRRTRLQRLAVLLHIRH